jgi:transposase
VWTAPRVARVIKDVFGVRYHDTHVRRILKALDWSSQKPIQRAAQRDESAIGAITLDGRFLLSTQEESYRSPDVVRFLKHLLRHIAGKLLIVWDGSPIHKGAVVKEFLSNGGAARIHLEALPAYAPDLNPKEGVWNYLKHVELRNLCCATLVELRRELRLGAARLRHRPHVVQGCIKQVYCDV